MPDRPTLPGWPRGMRAALAAAYVGVSVSTLNRLCQAGDFPASVQITPRAAVWLIEDLDAWLDRRAGRVPESDGSEWMTA